MKSILLSISFACIMFTGCSKGSSGNIDKPTPPPPVPPPAQQIKIPINILTGAWTKATDSAFENGDKVGVYVVNYSGDTPGVIANSGNHVSNISFTYSSTWAPETPIYWKDQTTKADFYCYYPHNANITTIAAYPFSVKANQSAIADYKASDLLFGKTTGISPTPNAIAITVKHVMSNLIVKLTAGDGYTAQDLTSAKITITNLKTESTINLATGIATAVGNAQDITPFAEATYSRALVVPQTVSDANLIKIEIGSYIYILKETITLEPNKQHTCTLIVNKTNEGINITIGGWEQDGKDHGGTVG